MESQVLKRLDYPAYCVRMLENGLIAISGGGGTAKTGVSNCIELGLADYSADISSFQTMHIYEPSDAVMKFASFSCEIPKIPVPNLNDKNNNKKNELNQRNDRPKVGKELQQAVFIVAAVQDTLEIYRLDRTVEKGDLNSPKASKPKESSTATVKKRKDSRRQSQNTQDAVTRKSQSDDKMSSNKSTNDGQIKYHARAALKLINVLKCNPNSDDEYDVDDAYEDYQEEFQQEKGLIQRKRTLSKRVSGRIPSTSHNDPEHSVNVIAVCKMNKQQKVESETICLCAGTSNGDIVVWNVQCHAVANKDQLIGEPKRFHLSQKRVHVFKQAHSGKEIDELQVNSVSYLVPLKKNKKNNETPMREEKHQLLSLGKDCQCIIWSLQVNNI
jgi:hypothetical protein